MGTYINRTREGDLGARGKAAALFSKCCAVPVFRPPQSLKELPKDMALVCVVDNKVFDAAVLVLDDEELARFLNPSDKRHMTWLLLDRMLALELADK